MSGHKLAQMAEMNILEAFMKNHTYTDQSYARKRCGNTTSKKVVEVRKNGTKTTNKNKQNNPSH